MAKLTPESAWEFADAIKAIVKPQTTRRKATVQSVDKDGTVWVNLPGSSTVTPIQSTGANVSPGDTVLTELRGTSLHITENQTNPAIGENTARSIARQETQHAEAMAKQAQTIADEAQAVAEATNQHFFTDDNGAHITDVTQDEWTQAVADEFSDYDPTQRLRPNHEAIPQPAIEQPGYPVTHRAKQPGFNHAQRYRVLRWNREQRGEYRGAVRRRRGANRANRVSTR